jgi:ribonuclease-3
VSENLAKLEHRLGYKFRELRLLERAMTHRSWAHENRSEGTGQGRDSENESLEFVGDSVLGLAMAEQLYVQNPALNEGQLTMMKHRLVSTETLARISSSLELGNYLRVGRGEEKTGGRAKQALLADALEAVIGAIFFDGGYIEARHFVRNIFADELKKTTPDGSVDYKTMLQERLQAQRLGTPKYRVVKTEGLPHARTFSVEAVWKTGRSSGKGRSKKTAEMMAARLALESLEANSGKSKTKPKEHSRRMAE